MRAITEQSQTISWTAARSTARRWIRSLRACITFTLPFSRWLGENNLLAVHVLAIFVVAATALVVRRIGARVADDWAGAWSGIGYAVFVHAYRPGDTLGANSEIFASLPLALSVLVFLQGQRKAAWGLMFLSGALVGVATLIRQPSAVTLGVMLAYLVYGWLIPRYQSFGRVLAAGSGVMIGFIAVIAALAWYYRWQGNLHDAYLWAWAFAIRYVESETTFLLCSETSRHRPSRCDSRSGACCGILASGRWLRR